VFENRVLRIFGRKSGEVTRERRKLYNEEFNDLCSSPNIFRMIKSRRMKLAAQVSAYEKKRGVYRILVGKHEGKRTLESPRL
jgi:hypothetical protein